MTVSDLLYPAILVVILSYKLLKTRSVRRRLQQAEQWPFVEGQSHGGRIGRQDRVGRTYVEIDYSYSVNGEYYAGQFELGPFATVGKAQDFLASFPAQRVIVRYDPSEFGRSAVREQDQMPA